MVARKRNDLYILLAVFAGILVINILSQILFFRIDFTAEKRFTLTNVSRNILKDLKEPVQITVYLDGSGLPAGFRRLRNSTADLLKDFQAYSGGNLKFDFVNPTTGSQQAQEESYEFLTGRGIEPTSLSVKTEEGISQKIIFPAALVSYKGVQIPVKLLQNRAGASPEEVLNNSIQNLEYAFASAIKKAAGDGTSRIGFTEGHGELSDLQLNDAMNALGDANEVGRVNLETVNKAGLDKLNLLIIAKPETGFTEAEKYKIDYFLMNGGRILWAIDQVSAELDSLRGAAEQLAFPKKLNLDDMLFRYGVRINYDLIADMNSAQIPLTVGNVGGQPQIQLVPWLFYPVFVPVSADPLVKNLDGIRSEFPSTVDLLEVAGIKSTVILASSPFSRALTAPTMLSLKMVEKEPDPQEFRGAPKAVGAVLEGEFPSVFRNRPLPAGITENLPVPQKSKPGKMIVLADGDMLKNQVNLSDGSHYPLGFDRFTGQQYGNRNLLLNAVDYLMDDSGLIGLRTKEVRLRLLDKARIREEKTFWQVVNIALPLGMLIAFAIFQHYYRLRKYAR